MVSRKNDGGVSSLKRKRLSLARKLRKEDQKFRAARRSMTSERVKKGAANPSTITRVKKSAKRYDKISKEIGTVSREIKRRAKK